MEKLKLGFLGGGINSAVGQTHFIASRMDNHFDVVAGCFSRDKERNLETATQWDINHNRLYSSWQDLLRSEANCLDAVVVLTPTPQHPEQVIAALRSGFNVICEKALAPSIPLALKIKRIALEAKRFLGITFNYSGYPMIRELRQIVMTGKLGKLHQIQIEMPQEGFLRRDDQGNPASPQSWRLYDNDIPTLSLDLGVHLHHLINFLTDLQPIKVVSTHTTNGNFPDVVDGVSAIAEYENGLVANIWYTKTALGHRNGLRVRIFGSDGSAEWFQLEPEILSLSNRRGQRSILDRSDSSVLIAHTPGFNRFKAGHPAGFIEAFANIYRDFAVQITGSVIDIEHRNIHNYSVDSAIAGLEFLDAMRISSKKCCWQTIK